MTTTSNTKDSRPGDEVMKAIGGLDAASTALKAQGKSRSALTEDEAVGILTIIGRALLKIFGK